MNKVQTCAPVDNQLKFLLLSIQLKKTTYTKTLLDRKLIAVITLKAEEWRSEGPNEEGITPTFSQQLVSLKFDKPGNLMFVTIRDMNRLGEKVAECQTRASVFLENGNGTLSLTLKKDDEELGEITFETRDWQKVVEAHDSEALANEEYPHVKVNCFACKDTH